MRVCASSPADIAPYTSRRRSAKGSCPSPTRGCASNASAGLSGGSRSCGATGGRCCPGAGGPGLTVGQRYDYLAGSLWWFNDALTFGFTLFIFAAGLGLLVGRPFVVQRLSAIGMVIPLAFIVLNLLRYLWATRVVSGSGTALALGALRVNLSMSWVIFLACARGLTQEHGVFLRTSKFRGRPAVGELRLVAIESILAATGLVLALGVLAVAGYTVVGLVLAALLGWSVSSPPPAGGPHHPLLGAVANARLHHQSARLLRLGNFENLPDPPFSLG